MTETLQISIENHIAHVQLNRPDSHNAIDGPIMNGLREFATEMANPGEVRVIVLSGIGKSFCAGLDMSSFAEMNSGELSAESEDVVQAMADISPEGANQAQQVGWMWQEIPVPVIAAVQGAALGGGLNLALGADIRFAAADSRLSIMEIKWGLIPDMAISTTLRNIMPLDKAKELILTGRVIDGSEAERVGLVTALHDDPLSAAHELANRIAARSPDAVRAAKSLLNQAWMLADADALRLEAQLQMAVLGGTNQIEAVTANLAKRAPAFVDQK